MNSASIAALASVLARLRRSWRVKFIVMLTNAILSAFRKRNREFKSYGYDLPASRKFILEQCGFRKGTILEVGTGKGHLAACLSEKGFRIISVDLDPETLKIARAHLAALKLERQVIFRKMNAEKLLFSSRSFAHVISVDFFHHAKNPLRCLREMMRVTRKTLLIADLNKKDMRIMDQVHRKEGNKHEASRITFQAMKTCLMENGFTVKSYRHTCHQVFLVQRRKS